MGRSAVEPCRVDHTPKGMMELQKYRMWQWIIGWVDSEEAESRVAPYEHRSAFRKLQSSILSDGHLHRWLGVTSCADTSQLAPTPPAVDSHIDNRGGSIVAGIGVERTLALMKQLMHAGAQQNAISTTPNILSSSYFPDLLLEVGPHQQREKQPEEHVPVRAQHHDRMGKNGRAFSFLIVGNVAQSELPFTAFRKEKVRFQGCSRHADGRRSGSEHVGEAQDVGEVTERQVVGVSEEAGTAGFPAMENLSQTDIEDLRQYRHLHGIQGSDPSEYSVGAAHMYHDADEDLPMVFS